jgi:hypothetical protein
LPVRRRTGPSKVLSAQLNSSTYEQPPPVSLRDSLACKRGGMGRGRQPSAAGQGPKLREAMQGTSMLMPRCSFTLSGGAIGMIPEGGNMKPIFAAALIAVALAPSGVLAQERVGDAALGAVSGAVVLGPVGAAAGAVIGYTAGPAIARSWGVGGYRHRYARRSYRRSAKAAHRRTAAAHKSSASKGRWYNVIRQ